MAFDNDIPVAPLEPDKDEKYCWKCKHNPCTCDEDLDRFIEELYTEDF